MVSTIGLIPRRAFLAAFLLGVTWCVVPAVGARKQGRPEPAEIGLSPVEVSDKIDITGATAPEGRTLTPIAFRLRAGWVDGSLLMRFPETLSSSMGLHFIDHHRSDMLPLSKIERPEWHRNKTTGEIRYRASTPHGVEFSGKAVPREKAVELEFRVTNSTERTLRHGGAQMCLTLSKCTEFSEKNTVDNTFTWIDGRYTSLASTTPTPQKMGRPPWLIVQKKDLPDLPRRSHPDGWWVVDQRCDYPLVVRESADGEHLVAIWWQGATGVMTNTTVPCMHSRMPRKPIKPGGEVVWRGRVYLMPNKPEKLLRHYKDDSKKRSGQTGTR